MRVVSCCCPAVRLSVHRAFPEKCPATHAPPRPTCSNPALEQEVELRRWALPWRAVTLFDPLLQPLRRRFFGQTVGVWLADETVQTVCADGGRHAHR